MKGIQFEHKDINHIAWNWETIDEFNKNGYCTKKELIEKTGLEKYTYDFALPQSMLVSFVEEAQVDYGQVISTTVYVYSEEYRHGIMLSCNDKIQIALDKWYNGDFDHLYTGGDN